MGILLKESLSAYTFMLPQQLNAQSRILKNDSARPQQKLSDPFREIVDTFQRNFQQQRLSVSFR